MTRYETGYNAGLNGQEKTGMSEDYFEGYEQGQIERDDQMIDESTRK